MALHTLRLAYLAEGDTVDIMVPLKNARSWAPSTHANSVTVPCHPHLWWWSRNWLCWWPWVMKKGWGCSQDMTIYWAKHKCKRPPLYNLFWPHVRALSQQLVKDFFMWLSPYRAGDLWKTGTEFLLPLSVLPAQHRVVPVGGMQRYL